VNPFGSARPKLRAVLLALTGIVVVAVTLFRVPLATIFTLGVLLICPLIMVGIHGGVHGADRNPSDEVRSDTTDRTREGGRRVPSRLARSPHDFGPGRSASARQRLARREGVEPPTF
jgi:hypothetical protein